jgi:hypothetical protein
VYLSSGGTSIRVCCERSDQNQTVAGESPGATSSGPSTSTPPWCAGSSCWQLSRSGMHTDSGHPAHWYSSVGFMSRLFDSHLIPLGTDHPTCHKQWLTQQSSCCLQSYSLYPCRSATAEGGGKASQCLARQISRSYARYTTTEDSGVAVHRGL